MLSRDAALVTAAPLLLLLLLGAASGSRQRRQGPWGGVPPGHRGGHGGGGGNGWRGPPGLNPNRHPGGGGGGPGEQPGGPGGPSGPSGQGQPDGGGGASPPGPGLGGRQGCVPSLTTINGGQQTCSGQLVFEDNFNHLEQWSNDVHMAGPPDYEFVVYKRSPRNIFINDGIMTILAFLTEDRYGPGFVSNGTMFVRGCTSSDQDLCERTAFSYNILPPVRSARVHTANSFTFRYGVVEMRVRGPRGDWLYPQLTLKPSQSKYGPHFSSGEIRLPSHFGNRWLREAGGAGGGNTTIFRLLLFSGYSSPTSKF
ncbi:beta-1,3-glucan-binding protein-like [Frankliniella occidentalis]|uniref:Beta-1,3-glucan-binding protein-like n=1 Tax=Frankliniella occidentalis TaxID=133901 RepID=A0A9C6X3I0_FRAOC|nr:beta-1,3-glucan-binding protein-like [Frankliniella occidentalis]